MTPNSIINPKSPVLRNGLFLWAYCAILRPNLNRVNLIFKRLQRIQAHSPMPNLTVFRWYNKPRKAKVTLAFVGVL